MSCPSSAARQRICIMLGPDLMLVNRKLSLQHSSSTWKFYASPTFAAADRLKAEGPAPRGSPLAVTTAVVQREFVRHMQQCHLLRAKLHDGGALCQVPLLTPTLKALVSFAEIHKHETTGAGNGT